VTNLRHLSYILQQDCQLDPTRQVLVGVSGGPDSLFLLDILWRLGYSLVVAHLNHGLRNEAEADSRCVREAAQSLGLTFVLEEADITAFARSHGLSIEEAARIVRYQFLFKQAGQHQAQAVAVAHTADDQVETVVMHLLRGAGLTGLKGMSSRLLPNPWSGEIALIRPLLGIFRDEILAYCSENDLQPVFDHSNLDTTFFRNRLRQELIPILETYNTGVKTNLLRMAQTLAGDDQVLETLTNAAWQDCCMGQGMVGIALDTGSLLAQPLSIQRRLVRRAISFLRPGLRDIDFATVERTLAFAQQPIRSAQLDLASGLRLSWEGERLWVANWEAGLPIGDWPQMVAQSLQLSVPGYISLPGKWHIQAEPVGDVQEAITQASTNTNLFQAWIDLHSYQLPFVLRTLLPGDRFQPLGMDGLSVKLSNFFINVKMPRRVRQLWPLVCLGGVITWIPGYRLAHSHRLTSSSTRVVFLQMVKD
jgi:tRNA(Ile)-lysidine synthase